MKTMNSKWWRCGLIFVVFFSWLIVDTASANEVPVPASEVREPVQSGETQSSGGELLAAAETTLPRPQPRADEYVNIPDDVLRKEIIWQLNYYHHLSLTDNGAAASVTESQMEKLTSFSFYRAAGEEISTLEGIQYAVNLTGFDISLGAYVNDNFTTLPTGFGKLKLKTFKVRHGELANIDELKNMTTLKEVKVSHNNLSDLTGLQGTVNLEVLIISSYSDYYSNQMGGIKDFAGLEDCTKLKQLVFTKYDDDTGASRVVAGAPEASYEGQGLQSLAGLNCADTLEVLELGGHPGLKSLAGLENYTALRELTCNGGGSYNGRRQEYTLPAAIVNNSGLTTDDKLTFEAASHTEMYRVRGLQGSTALAALASCPALESVTIIGQGVEDLTPLAGHAALTTINMTRNRITTLEPLADCLALKYLRVSDNLLTNLKGLKLLDQLQLVDCSQQAGGARTTNDLQVSAYVSNYLVGLLEDISDLNTASLKEFHCDFNRLTSLTGLEGAAKLEILYASANKLTNTVTALKDCISLITVYLYNNYFESFANIGISNSKDTLQNLYVDEQGVRRLTISHTSHPEDGTLTDLSGLEEMKVLKVFQANCNLIDNAGVQCLPGSLTDLQLNYNEITSDGLTPLGRMAGGSYVFDKLKTLYADANYIGDVRPIENLPMLQTVMIRSQVVRIPQHGGTMTIVDDGSFRGIELDVLKTEKNLASLTINKGPFGTWHSLDHLYPELKAGSAVVRIRDDDYDLYNENTIIGFEYTSFKTSAANMANVQVDGRILYEDVPYDLASEVILSITADKSEVEVGDTITWTITMQGENHHLLRKPRFYSDRKNTAGIANHTLETSYPDSEYKYGVRIAVNGSHLPLSGGVWGTSVSEMNKQVNDTNVAVIKIVTRVGSGDAGDEVQFTFGTSGDNYPREDVTAAVTIKSSIPEELKLLKVPEVLDFGNGNQAYSQTADYALAEANYSAVEKAEGFYVQVYDSNQGSNRTAWEVSGQLSELRSSSGEILKNSVKQPALIFDQLSLEKVTEDASGNQQVTVVSDNDPNVPIYAKKITFVAGGASQKLSTAELAKGSGTWNVRIPFAEVTLSIPEAISNKAGYTYSGTLTWTLDAVP